MKKRILAGVMGLAMLLTACGGGASSSTAASTPASSAASSAAAVSGTFEGSSVGMQGTVTVSMTVEDGKITAVELTECHETPSIASVAMERLPQLMVEHQTTTLDNVTGATLASGAIMRAATAAAEAAGLDMDQLEANAYSEPAGEDETWDTDVLVVGGGGAGFSSAITAAQEGANVILIEKSSALGGNTLMQGGAFNAVDTAAQSEVILTEAQKGTLDSYLALSTDDPDLHFDEFPEWAEVLTQLQSDINTFYAENAGTTAGVDMPGFDSIALHMWHIYVGGLRQMNDGTWMASDIDLARQLAESALGTFEWMRDGLGLNAPSGEGAGSDLFTVLGAMWPRTHPVETSTELIDKLRDVAEAAGVTIYTETAATSLLTDDTGRVIGATAEQANGTKITINTTKGVVLASGGYCANPAMVKEYDKYWGDDLSDHTLTTNVGTNEGDGIVMAQAIGADVVGMEVAQMMPSSSPLKGTMTDGAWGDASEQIWIDGEGNRFVDEYAERPSAQAIRLILLTGAGKSEILSARWEDVQLKDAVLAATSAFTGRRRLIPLNAEAVRLIRSLPRREQVPWLFASSSGRRLSSVFHTWNLIRMRLGRPDLRLQDLRYSFAGFLMNMGVNKSSLKFMLGSYSVRTLELVQKVYTTTEVNHA